MKHARAALLAFAVVALSGCGGGSSVVATSAPVTTTFPEQNDMVLSEFEYGMFDDRLPEPWPRESLAELGVTLCATSTPHDLAEWSRLYGSVVVASVMGVMCADHLQELLDA